MTCLSHPVSCRKTWVDSLSPKTPCLFCQMKILELEGPREEFQISETDTPKTNIKVKVPKKTKAFKKENADVIIILCFFPLVASNESLSALNLHWDTSSLYRVWNGVPWDEMKVLAKFLMVSMMVNQYEFDVWNRHFKWIKCIFGMNKFYLG